MAILQETLTALSLQEALEMLAQCFGETAAALVPGRHRDSIPGWDSMGALMFMAELDERFGVTLDADTSRAMSTIDDALAFLRQHGLPHN